jgi:hypothetical protein
MSVTRLTGQSISDEDAIKIEEEENTVSGISAPAASQLQTDVQELDPPRTLTFMEIKELIEQGKTDDIPNNRIIPDILNASSLLKLILVSIADTNQSRRLLRASRKPRSEQSHGNRYRFERN